LAGSSDGTAQDSGKPLIKAGKILEYQHNGGLTGAPASPQWNSRNNQKRGTIVADKVNLDFSDIDLDSLDLFDVQVMHMSDTVAVPEGGASCRNVIWSCSCSLTDRQLEDLLDG
jgi:hypothetical protein